MIEAPSVELHVNKKKDIVIFPISKASASVKTADGTFCDDIWLTAYFPIELKFPYTNIELAQKIKEGIEENGKHECYYAEKPTYEEKYYGIKGFKNAVRGNLLFSVGWDDEEKYVRLYLPCKSGYAYLEIDDTILPEDATWIDFANVVMEYINSDITKFKSFKVFKHKLNI